VLAHGGRVLPAVTVDTYNEELRDEEGFLGDRASRRAFRVILADWRDRLAATVTFRSSLSSELDNRIKWPHERVRRVIEPRRGDGI